MIYCEIEDILLELKGCDVMATSNVQTSIKNIPETSKLEFYRLIGEGYKAMAQGRTSSIEDVRKRLDQRRSEHVQH